MTNIYNNKKLRNENNQFLFTKGLSEIVYNITMNVPGTIQYNGTNEHILYYTSLLLKYLFCYNSCFLFSTSKGSRKKKVFFLVARPWELFFFRQIFDNKKCSTQFLG